MNRPSPRALAYHLLALAGFVGTWAFNAKYLLEGGGLGPSEFFGAAFANPLTAALTIDVYFSAFVFSAWAVRDARRLGIARAWAYVAVCFLVGLAVALPLYLARRERAEEAPGPGR